MSLYYGPIAPINLTNKFSNEIVNNEAITDIQVGGTIYKSQLGTSAFMDSITFGVDPMSMLPIDIELTSPPTPFSAFSLNFKATYAATFPDIVFPGGLPEYIPLGYQQPIINFEQQLFTFQSGVAYAPDTGFNNAYSLEDFGPISQYGIGNGTYLNIVSTVKYNGSTNNNKFTIEFANNTSVKINVSLYYEVQINYGV